MPNDIQSVLVVDDDDVFRARLGRAFSSRGWEVLLAGTVTEAIVIATEHAPDLAIIDLRIGDENGLDVVRKLRNIDPTVYLIMLTGWGSIATAIEAVRGGADHYLSKPVDADQILAIYSAPEKSAAHASSMATVPSLARVEWEHIQRVLTDCDGNISLAAKKLGLHRRSLQRKLSKYPPRV
jgi:two-component system response regulator RegA